MREYKKTILIIMMLLLLSPTLSMLLGVGDCFTINENRTRRGIPSVSTIVSNGFAAVNDWYNDSFGLRDLMVRIQHQIDYSLFRYCKTLFFTNDDERGQYLHYRSVIADEQIANEHISSEEIDTLIDEITKIKLSLESQNIAFKFLIPPQKNEVLPKAKDQLPVKRPYPNFYERMDMLLEQSVVADNYVPVLNVLREYNKIAPVFYNEDFHWNDYGAAIAFGTVINEWSNENGFGDAYSFDDFDFYTFKLGDNEQQLSNLSLLFYNIADSLTIDKPGDNQIEIISDQKRQEYTVFINNGSKKIDKTVLFIGDSYTPPALYSFNDTNCGITRLFTKCYFCHWDDATGVLNNLPEDVNLVIIERIESGYSNMGVLFDQLFDC